MAIRPRRSGRFEFTSNAANDSHVIIQAKKADVVTRIFNSGNTKFFVFLGGVKYAEVNPAYSVDIAGGVNVEIKALAAESSVQGIYDYLTPTAAVRSGRFDTLNPRYKDNGDPIDPANLYQEVMIANLDELGPNDYLYYRFFNSGKSDYGVYYSNSITTAPTNLIATVKPNQSIDIQLPELPSANKKVIWVKHTATTPSEHIEGSFDYIDGMFL
ncbi:MAG: hypothetical protein HUJ26_20225 [Planctomycetaceae bacterium]|nr:hypothetical protein [Planctomycetaceae bacterium]